MNQKMRSTINKVYKELMSMSRAEFMKEMEKATINMEKNKCCPVICQGQCQGFGWCGVASSFRKEENIQSWVQQ